jgi:uncharacterized protein (TIGR02757 family)
MGKSPRLFLEKTSEEKLMTIYSAFKHRFTTDSELIEILLGLKTIISEYGAIENLFTNAYKKTDIFNAMKAMSEAVKCRCSLPNHSMVPSPDRNSACKRLWLFLRWMVRKDNVDPGGWKDVLKKDLIVPVDTHMFRIAKMLGLTKRNQADMKSAVEITQGFAVINPEDPVRYDFCLTRFGIHPEISIIGNIYST